MHPDVIALLDDLRAARIARRLRQADVARHLGVTPGAVSHWETAIREPTMLQLARYARAVGARLTVLGVGGTATGAAAPAWLAAAEQAGDDP